LKAAGGDDVVHSNSHSTLVTFFLFPVSASSCRVAFIHSESAPSIPAVRITKLRQYAQSGVLDKSIVKIRIGNDVVAVQVCIV
jgi:hypothetical protein